VDHLPRSHRNSFTASSLDRAAAHRRDARWLAAREVASTTRYLPVWRLQSLFARSEPRPILLAPEIVRAEVPASATKTFLGVLGEKTFFSVDLAPDADPPRTLAERGTFHDLRQMAALLDRDLGAMLAYARAMAYWHVRHRYCGSCGSPTASQEGGHVRICTNADCGAQHFPRTDPAVIVLVRSGERGLFGRKASWPTGQYSVIAGFVEPGESIEDAVSREVREETGVELAEVVYQSSQPWPFPSSLMLAFGARAAGEAITVDRQELEDARWMTRDELRSGLQRGVLRLPPVVSVSYRLIEDWFDEKAPGALDRVVST
jgi:NAD+ diphosphatase